MPLAPFFAAVILSVIPALKRHREKREIARRQLQVFAVAAVVPPALFWVILYAGFWVVRGFRR